jgi:methylase of polypeptide subunit release factors
VTHLLTWQEKGLSQTRYWVSESTFSAPKTILTADDALKADDYYQKASEGAAFIYQGDFQNAKQLLQAVQRRIEKTNSKKKPEAGKNPVETFHRYRQQQAHRAQLLSRLLIAVEKDLTIPLRRAPDVKMAITEAIAPPNDGFLLSLRELLGFIGAHEWRKKGVTIAALNDKIHVHYGLFSPARGEYLDLLQTAPLPSLFSSPLSSQQSRAFDIGTGTGVIAALLAHRGVSKILATEVDPRALTCARENIQRLGFETQVEILEHDMLPPGQADLIICNPPWLPVRPTSSLERAIYDEDGRMLKRFLSEVASHLTAHGEAWLILSNLAELLGLRSTTEVETLIAAGGLKVIEKHHTRPKHAKATDETNMLFEARSEEITCLWRLKLNSI